MIIKLNNSFTFGGVLILQGDSGGPIMAGTTQIGISSFVQAEAGLPRCERGAVFTRVSTYVTNGWIAANML